MDFAIRNQVGVTVELIDIKLKKIKKTFMMLWKILEGWQILKRASKKIAFAILYHLCGSISGNLEDEWLIKEGYVVKSTEFLSFRA